MKERPILFSTPMVHAILNNSKTQTRRVAKLTASGRVKEIGGHRNWHPSDPGAVLACPYGQPGDLLWVRETWATAVSGGSPISETFSYAADFHGTGLKPPETKWNPSIHMPRNASRITLKITGVRLERLQDISDTDAQAEGCTDQRFYYLGSWSKGFGHRRCPTPQKAFEDVWTKINGWSSWELDPWVWVIEFIDVNYVPF